MDYQIKLPYFVVSNVNHMAVDSRQISATIDIEVAEEIQKIADKERRSFSAMIAILLEQAVKKLSKKQLQES